MPIYEFYCDSCNTVFNFFSSRIDTTSQPDCPRCGKEKISRQISKFATMRTAEQGEEDMLSGLDETKMERAFESLMKEADALNTEDPRQMAAMMRKFSGMTGLNLGDAMEEAISRMEAGEDPDQVEREMGDVLGDDNFSLETIQKKARAARLQPVQDEKLYRLS